MKKLSIVVPVYQNEPNLPKTVPTLLALSSKLPNLEIEIVFVNDGSRDRSLQILQEMAAAHPEIKVISLTRNFGQTPATQAGLRFASGDCAVIVSCDLQEPPEKIVDMVNAWQSGAKYVIGERVKRAEGWKHRTVSSFYWRIVRWFAFRDFPSMGYDFCLLDRQVIQDIISINEKNSSIFVLIYWFGYRPVRIPIEREVRQRGKSQWGIANKIRFTVDTLIGFTYVPSRFITYTGFLSAFLAACYLVFMFVYWGVYREAPQGWMTVVSLVVIFGSLILVSLGILSEYLLRILDETRKRPLYVVDSVLASKAKETSREVDYGQ